MVFDINLTYSMITENLAVKVACTQAYLLKKRCSHHKIQKEISKTLPFKFFESINYSGRRGIGRHNGALKYCVGVGWKSNFIES